jgi:hypothetical protein
MQIPLFNSSVAEALSVANGQSAPSSNPAVKSDCGLSHLYVSRLLHPVPILKLRLGKLGRLAVGRSDGRSRKDRGHCVCLTLRCICLTLRW